MSSATPGEGAPESVDPQLRYLYEISTLLIRFESVERTVRAVLDVMARALPMQSAMLVLGRAEHPWTLTGYREGADPALLAEARDRAQGSYAYLMGFEVGLPPEPALAFRLPSLPDERAAEPGERRFIFLPLVDNEREIFGALQIEGAARLDESDLMFANAVGNQLAVALHRHSAIEARQEQAEAARSRAEDAEVHIRDQFDFARSVTASLGEGVLAVGRSGRITVFNPAAERLLGWRADEVLGKRPDEVVRFRSADGVPLSPDDDPLMMATRGYGLVRSEKHTLAGRDGVAHPVSYTAAPLRHGDTTTGAVLAFRDILEVQRAEGAQRLLSELTAVLVGSLDAREILASVVRRLVPAFGDLAFVDELGEDGAVRRIEVAFADEQRQRDLGDRVRDLAPRASWLTAQAAVLESGRPFLGAELVVATEATLALHQEIVDLSRAIGMRSAIVVPVTGRDGVLGTINLVTAESERRYDARDLEVAQEIASRTALAVDRARLYQEAQRATKARDQILAVVSHDLRGPLSTVATIVDLLLRAPDPADGARTREDLETVRRATAQMRRLIEDLRDSTSIDRGQLSVDPRLVDAAPLVTDALAAAAPAAARRSLNLVSDLAPDLPQVCVDTGRIRQVLTNLLDNAVKFTPEGGDIRVRAERFDHEVRFSVSDTGPGVPSVDLPYVFDRDWKSGAQAGTGLGLFISKGIVEAHGGRIWVESAPGQGATFSFTVPVGRA